MPPKKPVAAKVKAKTPAKPTPAKTAPGKGLTPKKPGATAGGQKPGQGTKGGSPKKSNKPKEPVWTKHDDAARKIQTRYRQYLGKMELERRKKKKRDYIELMDKLEKEAFVKLVQMEQEQAEKERKKEEEERRRKKEEQMRKKRMLEAAFDGDNDAIHVILTEVTEADNKKGVGHDVIGKALRTKHQMAAIQCEDANNNTPLSEAASGGSADTIRLLLKLGADCNSRGQFERTPLYRAAFAGHMEACQVLLQHGSDPRLYASDGQNAEQIASVAALADMIQAWDISETEALLEKLDVVKQRRAEDDRQIREAEKNKLEDKIEEAKKEYETLQKRLNKAYAELNKRITEHDEAVYSGFEKTNLTLQAVHDAEDEVEILKMKTEKAQNRLAQSKLRLREQQKEGQELMTEYELPGLKISIREIDDVLLRDVGNKIKQSGRWPLIIDPSGQACTFLRYQDTNYINAVSPANMEPNKIRLALLGAIRYGKPAVLDMMEIDMFHTCCVRFDEIQTGLMDMLMDKTIIQDERYLKLVKKSDGDEYNKNKFNDLRVQNFKFFIVTKNVFPSESLLEKTYAIRIHMPS